VEILELLLGGEEFLRVQPAWSGPDRRAFRDHVMVHSVTGLVPSKVWLRDSRKLLQEECARV
jgi:hypothetical protein